MATRDEIADAIAGMTLFADLARPQLMGVASRFEEAFFPKDAREVDEISRAVAHDIRNQYIIGYKPTNPTARGGYRTVKVEARASGYGKLQVRTRSGYYAEQQRAAKQEQ